MNNIKIKRINNELVKVISQTIADESTDKLLHTVTITGADTSADLSFAKIYFTSLTDKEPKELEITLVTTELTYENLFMIIPLPMQQT